MQTMSFGGSRWLKNTAILVAAMGLPGPALAQAMAPAPNVYIPNLSEVMKSSGIFFAGYAAAGYTADLNGGNSLTYHIFDGDGNLGESANSFALNQVGLIAARVPDEGVGFKVVAIGGSDAKILNLFYGSSPSDFALFIAYGSYTQGKLTLIAGRFPALSGYELAPTVLNTQISRSLVLLLAQPVAEEGVRINYNVLPNLTATLSVINSAQNVSLSTTEDNNASKTIEFGGTYTLVPGTKLAVYDYYGIDPAPPTGDGKKNYLDVVGTYGITPKLSVAFNGDWVDTLEYKADNQAAKILGIAGYINYQIAPQYLVSMRAEDIQLSTYRPTRSSNNIKEVTLTGVYSYNPNLDFKVEGRYDLASSTLGDKAMDFQNGITPTGSQKYSQHQAELEAMAIFKFGGL
ncbi:MAG: outer membrane beta-barrel protein [Acidocella sp.]|nr:outer membrane beta-barrel protein [Acidocella sp.]